MLNNDVYIIIMTIFLVLILIVYILYILKEEQEKIKYYNNPLYYSTKWDKYNTMLKKQKRIMFKKRMQLLLLKILVFMKKVFVWK